MSDKNDTLDRLDEAMARGIYDGLAGPFSWNKATTETRKHYINIAKLARIAMMSHIAADGWQLVPVVATPDMAISGAVAWCDAVPASETYVDCAHDCYTAMTAASPTYGGDNDPR